MRLEIYSEIPVSSQAFRTHLDRAIRLFDVHNPAAALIIRVHQCKDKRLVILPPSLVNHQETQAVYCGSLICAGLGMVIKSTMDHVITNRRES